MRQGRRRRLSALVMAVLLCLTNLTVGMGDEFSNTAIMESTVPDTEAVIVPGTEGTTDAALPQNSEPDEPQNTGSEGDVSEPSVQDGGNGKGQENPAPAQTEGTVLAGPVEMNDPSAGNAAVPPAPQTESPSLPEPPKDGSGTADGGGGARGNAADAGDSTGDVSTGDDPASAEGPDGETAENEKSQDSGYLYEASMSIRELSLLPKEEAGAATEVDMARVTDDSQIMLRAASTPEDLWTCSDYYVNEEDMYEVTKNADFSLKYQVEFHTSIGLEPGEVQIRVPQTLLNDRQGNGILPSQIGVPKGTPDRAVESLNSPFNWYTDEASKELVFFNYRAITAGTNTAFQVLYHPVKVMEICDQTTWAFTPVISVAKGGEAPQTKMLQELRGSIDTHARIVELRANAFSDGSISCMPALYTADQVKRILGTDVPAFLSEEGKWLFVAWQIDCQGDHNQPWNLRMDADLSGELLKGDGEMCVAGSVTRVTGTGEGDAGKGDIVKQYIPSQKGNCLTELSSADLDQYMKQGAFHLTTIAVTAVRKDMLKNDQSVLSLDPSLSLTPQDGVDPAQTLEADASWTFVDYTWTYQGDVVGVGAWTGERYADHSVHYGYHDRSLPGWINEYRVLKGSSEASGPVPFKVRSECRGYAYTHYTEGSLAGNYKTGTGYEVTTADDVVYAIFPQAGGADQAVRVLSGEDYYYSSVSVSITDRGMDIYEDRQTGPMSQEQCPGADRSTFVYAMYEGSDSWEMVCECPWNASGKISHTFTGEQLSRKPYRIKVVHNAADYESSCDIDTEVRIRPDSPVMAEYLALSGDGDGITIRLENLGAVLARSTGTGNDGWFHDRSVSGGENYSEPGLIDLTRSLHGEISMRANSFASLTELKKHARALKTASRENDPENGCIRLEYTIGALEGYRVYSQEAADRIRRGEVNFPVPNRREYVIYDLLPEGVIPDPSLQMKAGLVMGGLDKHLTTPSLWDQKNVHVRVDPQTGVVEDWKNTGRYMLILNVTIDLEPEQIARMCEGMWMNGIGVRFCAYCPYKDLKQMKKQSNIAAIMPGEGRDDPLRQILGTEEETACDDGIIVPYSDEVKEVFRDFGPDIDSDGICNLRTVLYAFAPSQGDTAVSLSDGISLTVKADRDSFSQEGLSAVVGEGDPYTYRIDVTNSSLQPISELVIADHLEIAATERALAESDREFDEVDWQGTLEEVDTDAAKRLGIRPVVYLSEDPNAPLPGEGKTPESILTEENGWYLAEEFEPGIHGARSIAADLRTMEDGSSFQLNQGDSVHISLHMMAPHIGDGEGETRAEHAYNCASFYSISPDEPEADLVTGDAVEVTLMEKMALTVEKRVKGDVPAGMENQSYVFCLTREDLPVALRAYRLEKKKTDMADNVTWEEDGELHTTDRRGFFYLRKDERAVFDEEAGGTVLEAEEIRSVEFEARIIEETTQEGRELIFENSWRPTLYLTKKIYGALKEQDLSADVFRVRVTAGGRSLAGTICWTVDPQGEYVENQVVEEHVVDEESCVDLHAGEIIAFHPADAGCLIEVQEMESCFGPDSDYVAVTSKIRGILSEDGTQMVLENAWKWKDLILQKNILHREEIPAEDVFTFRLWKMREISDSISFDPENPSSCADPVPGVEGFMGEQTFVTDENGSFALPCAGRDVVLKHLEAGCEYVIQETGMPEFYEAVNGGIVSAVMPVLGEKRYVTLTNSWKKRSLEVSKAVLSGEHVRRTTVCTPNFPGFLQLQDGMTELMNYSPAGMERFTIEFPVEVRLARNGSLQVITDQGVVETLTGTIQAGTVKQYSSASAQIRIQNTSPASVEGFFFYFTPYVSSDTPAGENLTGKTFSFCLEIPGEDGSLRPASRIPYTRSDGTPLTTDENGMFTLSSGTSAKFTDLGIEGMQWRLSETQDPQCPQVYPAGANPWIGTLGEGGLDISHALFINGEECQGMIRKSFVAARGDTTSQEWIAAQRQSGSLSMLGSEFMIETENENGAYAPLNGEIQIADNSDGNLYTCEISGGKLCLFESQSAILSGLAKGQGWRVTEIPGGVIKNQDTVLVSECTLPGEGRVITAGGNDQMICADFVNEIHSIPVDPESLICKEFLSETGWDKVAEEATLAFRLERYEDGIWKNASNVRWVQCLNGIPMTNCSKTGEDGIIRVKKEKEGSEGALAGIYILPIAIEGGPVHTEVYYTQHEAAPGDLRIKEALDLSDPSYGMLVQCEGLTFINGNSMESLLVEKQTDILSDQTFTMQIFQQFHEGSLPGRYLTYRICNAKSGEVIRTGLTDEQGCFAIGSGQQAEFELPSGSKWTVTEKNSGSWKLSSCTMEKEANKPVREDRGVTFELLYIEPDVTLTEEMMSQELKDPLTGQVLDFSLPSITIPHYIQMGERIMEITAIDDYVFYTSSVQSVKISEGIKKLGDFSFFYCRSMNEIELPQSLEHIGTQCFAYSRIQTLEIGPNVKTVGAGIARMCTGLKKIIIRQKREDSPFKDYQWVIWDAPDVEFSE